VSILLDRSVLKSIRKGHLCWIKGLKTSSALYSVWS
jgi:hypothetical protein